MKDLLSLFQRCYQRQTRIAHGFRSTAGIHQKRSVASRCAWTMNYHVWAAILEAYHKLHPKPKSITEFKELQVIW